MSENPGMSFEEKQLIVERLNYLTNVTVNQSLLLQAIINLLKEYKVVREDVLVEEFKKVQKNYLDDIEKQKSKIIVPEKTIAVPEMKFELVTENGNDSGKSN